MDEYQAALIRNGYPAPIDPRVSFQPPQSSFPQVESTLPPELMRLAIFNLMQNLSSPTAPSSVAGYYKLSEKKKPSEFGDVSSMPSDLVQLIQSMLSRVPMLPWSIPSEMQATSGALDSAYRDMLLRRAPPMLAGPRWSFSVRPDRKGG